MKYKKRLEALKETLRKKRLHSLIITKKENIAYISGFEGESSALIITSSDKDFIITDSRYKEPAEEALRNFTIRLADSSRHRIIKDIIKKYKLKRVGFESDWLSYNDFSRMKKDVLRKANLIPTRSFVEDLRAIKDGEEIKLIKESLSIAKKAFRYAKERIGPRYNGKRLAILIDNFMRSGGSQRPAFQTIVAQNPYSSYPHAHATDSAFGNNCAVVADIGAVFKGYNSDLTRVVFLGKITAKFKYIYNIVKAAGDKVIKRIKPGQSISGLDRIARQYIKDKGFGKFFLHSLGHGVGLEIHESPIISKKNKDILKSGMVFTVEPGIYIPGWGGLRLEDMVIVKEGGCEVLTDDIPK